MSKHQRKIQAALLVRVAEFLPYMPDSKQQCHKPGSQNRKKGFGGKRSKR